MKMKLLLLIILLSLFGATSFAHDLAVKNSDGVYIYYVWTNNNTELAVSFEGTYTTYSNEYSGNIVIPSSVEYNGKKYSVTSIQYYAFSDCTDLTSVTIPNSVTSIGNSAFQYSGLTSITIPESVTNIGQRAFYMCSSVASIVVADGNIVYDSREGCNAIVRKSDDELMLGCKNTTIPNSIKNIGKESFSNCRDLTHIIIPDGITSIGDWAFSYCGLESIEFPSSVETIGEFAFHYCTDLKSIIFPSSVKTIGKEAFTGCPLNAVTVNWQEPISINEKIFTSDNEIETIYYAYLYVPKGYRTAYQNSDFWNKFSRIIEMDDNAILFKDTNVEAICLENWDTDGDGVLSKDEAAAVTSLGTVFNRRDDISSFNELQYFTGLTSIDDEAFEYCGGLNSVIIPPNVNRIGERAFSSSRLTSVTIPDGVKTIGREAFSACTNMTSITIPSSVTSIEQSAFYASGLTSIEIPSSVTSIENYTFIECFSLSSVKIPNTVTRIGTWAFKSCKSLESIEIPGSVTNIDNDAFDGCTGLTSVTIPDGVETIGSGAFDGCNNLSSVTISKSVTSIGSSAFSKHALSSIVIDNGNTVYDSREGCNAIIKTSENELILGCKNTIIPNGVTSIGENAFSGCEGLTAVTIPSSVTNIGYLVFTGCPHLESIVVADGNTVYDSREDCNAIIKTSDNLLMVGCTNTKIPDGVTTIGHGAFRGCGIQTLIIPDHVTGIMSDAFYGCTNLTSVTLGNGMKSIYNSAFFGCNNLKSINLPEGLETIGEMVFDDCFSLTSITIPSSVKTIEWATFAHCNSLTSINIPSSISSIDSYAFAECVALNSVIVNRQAPVSINGSVFSNRQDLTLYVPIDSKDAYGSAGIWQEFKEIKEFVKKESTTYSVEEDNSLNVCVVEPTEKKVEIPESVTVDSKVYPVTAIAASAFENNTVIKEVSVPQTIEEIGDEAFAGCSSLSTIYCFAEEPIVLATTGANTRTRAGSQESATNVFEGVDKVTCLLYVPFGSVSKYKAADGWKDFKYIVGIGTTFIIGNVNGDNELDEKDLNAIVNHIMGKPQDGIFDVNMADVNKDGDVNAADVMFLAKLLGQGSRAD